MNLNSRIERATVKANALLRQKKSDIIVTLAPNFDTEKGWIVDVCNNYKTGKEDTALRERLEALQTIDEVTEELEGYSTNLPNVRRSNEYK